MCDSSQKGDHSTSASESALFFNYHEFSFSFYDEIGSEDGMSMPKEHDEDHKLCVTHFPNVYAPRGSAEFQMTRVVRVPRRFDQSRDSLETPQFSTQLPGSEPAAIVGDNGGGGGGFVRCGRYDTGGHVFGCSSVSPLSEHLNAAEVAEVVGRVNEYLRRVEYAVYGWRNLGGVLLDALTGGLWSWAPGPLLRGPVFQESLALEQYVAQLNSPGGLLHERGVSLVLPRRSGCLSLDFVVPRPT